MDIGQAALNAVMVEGQPGVIESEQVQDGGVEIVRRNGVFADVVADFVGRPVAQAFLQARARHPASEHQLMMIAAFAV